MTELASYKYHYLILSRVDIIPIDVAEPLVTLDVFSAILKHMQHA